MREKAGSTELNTYSSNMAEDDWNLYCTLWNARRSQENGVECKANDDDVHVDSSTQNRDGIDGCVLGGEDNMEAPIPMNDVVVAVSDIQYTTSTIPCCFRHSSNEFCIRLEDTMRDLMRNRKVLQKIPKLYVMKHGEQYWAVGGNRRLYVYKSLAVIGYLDHINVIEVPFLQEWFSKCSRSADVVVVACDSNNCAVNLCKKIFFEEKKRRRRGCYLCFWITTIFTVVLALAVAAIAALNIPKYKTEILSRVCKTVDTPECSTCSCPGLEICDQLPIFEYMKMKWRGITSNYADVDDGLSEE